jgi:hypothetical protein
MLMSNLELSKQITNLQLNTLYTLFFFWFSSFVNCISLFLKTISYLRHFNIINRNSFEK